MPNKEMNIVSIDLGTKNLIIRVNEQTVYDQPAAIVFDNETGQVFIGKEATQMREKIPASKTFIEPMSNGVISNVDGLTALLTEIFVNFVQVHNTKIWKNGFWKKSLVLVGIPSKMYRIDEDMLIEVLQGRRVPRIPIFSERFKRYDYFTDVLKAEKIKPIPEVKLAAIGSGAAIWDARGVFILDIGGGTADCAIISAGDIIIQDSVNFGGNNIDYEVQKYLEEFHYLTVTLEEAENTKIAAGAYVESEYKEEKDKENMLTIFGKNAKTGQPDRVEIPRIEIAKVISENLSPILTVCKNIMLRSPASFSRTIHENGLILTGGSSLLSNIDLYLKEKLNVEHVAVATTPEKCVIKGAETYEMHKYDMYEKGYIRPSR